MNQSNLLLTGGVGVGASETVEIINQVSEVPLPDIVKITAQIVIAIVTLLRLFKKKKEN